MSENAETTNKALIPVEEQQNTLDVLWALLRDAEERTNPEKDILRAIEVEQAYLLLNRIGYTKANPRWKES